MNVMEAAQALYETIGDQWPEGKCGHEWDDLPEEEKLGWHSIVLHFYAKTKK